MLARSTQTTILTTTAAAAALTLVVFGLQTAAQAQNPVIDEWRSGSAHYDPFNDHLYLERERVRVRESALDPHRHHVDFGSKQYVDRYFRNQFGEVIHEYGWTWTSHGRPHGKLTRVRVRSYPGPGQCPPGGGVSQIDRDTVVYSQPGGGRGGVSQIDRDTVVYSQPGGGRGGVSQTDRDTVLYSQEPGRPSAGGTTQRDRDTVIFSPGNGGNSGGNRRSSGNSLGSIGRQLGQKFGQSLLDR